MSATGWLSTSWSQVLASYGLRPFKRQSDVFPNPTTELVKFNFPVEVAGEYKVEIHDLNGKLVKVVIQDWLSAGKALLSFNTAYLPSGTYVVSVANEEHKLFTEKLVVTH